MTRTIVAIQGDTHAGHKLGLMCPNAGLPDMGLGRKGNFWYPTQTAMQKWLWGHYTDDIQKVVDLADGDPIILLHGGDATHGKRYPDGLVSSREFDQVLIACANTAAWLIHPNVTKVRLVQGTASHEMGEGSAPDYIAKMLAGQFPSCDIGVGLHYFITVDGVAIDVAHHGPGPGIRAWTRGNQLRYYTRDLIIDALAHDERPPRVMFRHHFHSLVKERVGVGLYECEARICPAYCGMTFYAKQATRSVYRLSCGTLVLEIVDGELVNIDALEHVTDLRTKEEL